MAYIVNQDIIDRVGATKAAQLTTDSGGTPDQAKLDGVREAAEGEVNGYIGRKYAVPVDLVVHADAAPTLREYTLDVAVFRLHSLRPPAPETAEKARNLAIKWLEGISKGTVALPTATTLATTPSNEPDAAWGSQEQNASELRKQ